MAYVVRMHHTTAVIQTNRITARFLRKVLDDVHDTATRGATGGPYSNGLLASSIYKEGPIVEGLTARGRVGSHLGYADIVERGARVHYIFPKAARGTFRFGDRNRPQLHFFWRRKGRWIFTPHIPMSPRTVGRSHPGQTGKHFLLKAITKAGVKYRLRIQVYEV